MINNLFLPPARNRTKKRGMTIPELLISSSILLIVVSLAIFLLFHTLKSFSKVTEDSSSVKNARSACYALSLILRETYELETLASQNTLTRFDGELVLTPGKNEVVIYPMGTDMFGNKNVLLITEDKNIVLRTYRGKDDAGSFPGYPKSKQLLAERALAHQTLQVKLNRDVKDASGGSLVTFTLSAGSEKKQSSPVEFNTKILLHIH